MTMVQSEKCVVTTMKITITYMYMYPPTRPITIRISGVFQLDSYSGCLQCTAKALPLLDDAEFGRCVKCQMMQCMAYVTKELSAHLLLELQTGQLTLHALT